MSKERLKEWSEALIAAIYNLPREERIKFLKALPEDMRRMWLHTGETL
jgi:hypothetical protein